MTGVVLVCGGRDYADAVYLCGFLDAYHATEGIYKLIQGGAGGADYQARCWAKSRGVEFKTYKANWSEHGKAAGPIRNRQMLDDGQPELVIAFPGGVGTADMVAYARSKNVPVIKAMGV